MQTKEMKKFALGVIIGFLIGAVIASFAYTGKIWTKSTDATVSDAAKITNDANGNWALIGSSGNGTFTSAIWRTTGCPGPFTTCMEFNGTSGFVDTSDADYIKGAIALTVTAWIKQPTLLADNGIVVKWDYQTQGTFGFQTGGTAGTLRVFIADSATDVGGNRGDTGTVLIANTSHFVCFVYNGAGATNADRLKVYVDAAEKVLTFAGTIPASLTSATATTKIGKFGGTLTRYFNGYIEDVRIFNTNLSATAISNIYNAGAGTTCAVLDANLKDCWKGNDGSGTTVVNTIGYPTDSPEVTFNIFTPPQAATFDMSGFRITEVKTTGSVKYQYRYDNTSPYDCTTAVYNGTWLTRTQVQGISDLTGVGCIQFKAQLNSNGTTFARIDHLTIPYSPYNTSAIEMEDNVTSSSNATLNYGTTAGAVNVGYDSSVTSNLVSNAGFEVDTTGWITTGPGFWLNAGATLTRDTAVFRSGVASGKIVAGTTAYQGASYAFSQTFSAGKSYLAEMWAKSDTTTETVQLFFGSSGGSEYCTSSLTLSQSWTKMTCTWNAVGSFTDVVIGVRRSSTNAITWYLDDVSAIEISIRNYFMKPESYVIPRETISQVRACFYLEYIPGKWEGAYLLRGYRIKEGNYWREGAQNGVAAGANEPNHNRRGGGIGGGATDLGSASWLGSVGADSDGVDFYSWTTGDPEISLGASFANGYRCVIIPLQWVRDWRDKGQNRGIIFRTPDRINTHMLNLYTSESATNPAYFEITYSLDQAEPITPRIIWDAGYGYGLFWSGQWHATIDSQDSTIVLFEDEARNARILKYDGHVWDSVYTTSYTSHGPGILIRESNYTIHHINNVGTPVGPFGETRDYVSTYPDDPTIFTFSVITANGQVNKGGLDTTLNDDLHLLLPIDTNYNTNYFRRTASSGLWSNIGQVIGYNADTAFLGERYPHYVAVTAEGTNIYIAYSRANNITGNFQYHADAFAQSNDGGLTWKDSAGSALSTPIQYWTDSRVAPDPTSAEGNVHVTTMIKKGADIFLSHWITSLGGSLGTQFVNNMTATDNDFSFGDGTNFRVGQTYAAVGEPIGRACFKLKKVGSPTQKVVVAISIDDLGTGNKREATKLLAPADITTAYQTLCMDYPEYTGSARIVIAVLPQAGGDVNNKYVISTDNANTYAGGNFRFFTTAWNEDATKDLNFELWRRNTSQVGSAKIRKLSAGVWSDTGQTSPRGYDNVLIQTDSGIFFIVITDLTTDAWNIRYFRSDDNAVTWSSANDLTTDATVDRRYFYVSRGQKVATTAPILWNTIYQNKPQDTEVGDIYFVKVRLIPGITGTCGFLNMLAKELICD